MSDATRRLHLHFEAEGKPGLLPLLEAATGSVIGGRFRLDGPIGVGRQSYLFAATDLFDGGAVVVKQPAFDYRRPLDYGRDAAAEMRRWIETERDVLTACRTGHLPRLLAAVTAPSPIPAAVASPVLSRGELFLVEELIAGETLTLTALRVWTPLPAVERERRAGNMVGEFIRFWDQLRAVGWHYGDLNADNLLIESETGRLRVVDGGSAVPAADEVVLTTFTPAYTTPTLFDRFSRGLAVLGNLSVVLPPLAKLLHFALTRREPLNGRLPDLIDPALMSYSAACRHALEAMLGLDEKPGELQSASEAVRVWIGRA